MPNDRYPNWSAREREIRDLMLQYLYDSGRAGKPDVPIDEIKEALDLSTEEYSVGFNNLRARRLLMFPGAIGCLALNLDGQFEVETSTRDDAGIKPIDKTDQMVVELQQSLKRMSDLSRDLQAEFDAYRSRPWWQRLAG